MRSSAHRLEEAARWVLMLTVLVSPWLLGGYRLSDQQWLYAGVLAAYTLWWLATLLKGPEARLLMSAPLVPAAAVIGLGVPQLFPLPQWQPTFAHALFAEWMIDIGGPALSVEPSATRLMLIRLGFAFLAALLATQLFSTPRDRNILWTLFAADGAVLGLFGLAQRLSWNGQLFWSIPLRYGGQPFASYVNRNNAAGFLLLCMAAGFAALAGIAIAREPLRRMASKGGRNYSRIRRPWSNTEVAVLVLTAGCILGIFSSLSRGGILACCLTFAVGISMLWVILGKRAIVYAATFLSLPVAGLLWLNMDHSFQQRLETLSSSKQLSDDARWAHWKDTVAAVPDAPLGFGLGTYRYANRPYQKHAARGWYYNADNQYVETLIELGPAGLLAVIAGVIALLRAAYGAWRDQRSDYRDVALLLTLLVLSQSQTSLTDYGIVMPANLLAAALLVGAALAAVSTSAVAVRAPAVSGLVAIICGTFLFALPAVGLAEVQIAAQQRAFVDQIPSLHHPIHRVELDEIDSLISTGTALTERRPDDAALQQALADLWIYRFRLEASAELLIYVPSLSPLQAWEFSSPLNLLRQSVEVLRTTGPGGLEALRSHRVMVDNLVPAWTHLQRARAACRYAPRTHLLLGCLSVLMAEDDRTALNHLKHEVALSPFDASHLVAAGLMIRQLGDDRTTYSLWERALTLNPELARRLFQAVLREVDNSTMLSMAVPDSIPVLLRFAESTPSDPARQAAIARLESLLPTDERATGYDHWVRGRIAALQQNWQAAIASYERAVAAQPFDVDYRVDLAKALEHQQRWDEAIQQLIRGQRSAPHRKDLAERVRRLYQKQAEYRPRNTSTSESESHTPHTSDSTPAQSPGDDAG